MYTTLKYCCTNIILLLLLPFLLNCNGQRGNLIQNNKCKQFYNSIDSIWQPVNNGDYYKLKLPFNDEMIQFNNTLNECFSGLNSNEVISILGTPNENKNGKLIYYLNDVCLSRNRDCIIKVFEFKENVFMKSGLPVPKPFGVK